MTSVQYRFTNLDTAIAEVHTLLEEWGRDALSVPTEDTRLHRMKLVIHEWMANLIQHADFEDRTPLIELTLDLDDNEIHCTVEDNSAGFDFSQQLIKQRTKLQTETMAERGRGLLIILDGTEDLRYLPLPAAPDQPRQRLEFWISVTPIPCLDTPS